MYFRCVRFKKYLKIVIRMFIWLIYGVFMVHPRFSITVDLAMSQEVKKT